MTKERKQEFTLRISQANKTEMIVILYDMLEVYLNEAKEAYLEEQGADFSQAIIKARGCIRELIASLNYEIELARILLKLYLYCSKELATAQVRNEVTHLDNVMTVINKLQDTYRSASKMDNSAPVMSNTQAVYAGLTYGKNTIHENIAIQDGNRGYLI